MDVSATATEHPIAPRRPDAGILQPRALVRDVLARSRPLTDHPAMTQPDVELSVPADPANVAVVRHVLGGMAEALGLGADQVADIRLAVSEACTNVVVHAYADREAGRLDVEARVDRPLLHVTVRDQGRGLLPRPDSPGLGLGLPLVASVTERVELGGSERGNEVRMTFVIPEDG